MALLSWLNRNFRTSLLSAPLAAMADGAEGVSVVHPMVTEGTPQPEKSVPAETPAPADAVSASEEATDPLRYMKEAMARYAAEPYSEPDSDKGMTDGIGGDNAPIVRLANTLIQQAIKERASDIHIEPGTKNMRVRYRIDGILHEVMPMPKYLQMPLTVRYKVLAGIDMATHRGLPQEGRIPVRYMGSDYSIRVNTQPTHDGDHITFHIDSMERIQRGLDQLGFTPNVQVQLEKLLDRQRGLVLIAGPAGSGKTTTQYCLGSRLSRVGVHIATVEERATHRLPGTTQIVVDRLDSGTLAASIRMALQHDVDVMCISDIRDKATAQAALDAAASSLVIATVHGDEALSTLVRLTAMGLDPGLIAETICGVVAQRLVRKLCTHCKETYEVASKDLRSFGLRSENPEESVTLARGVGCEYCRQTGYYGRLGLYELFRWDPALRKMFADRVPLPHLKEAALGNNRMEDLKADGLVKILTQTTTPEEVLRACD